MSSYTNIIMVRYAVFICVWMLLIYIDLCCRVKSELTELNKKYDRQMAISKSDSVS